MKGTVFVEKTGAVATVTVSNPAKKNALTLAILSRLRSAFAELSDAGTRCIVLRGDGEDAFCAGYDISAIPAGGAGEGQVLLSSNPFDDMIRAVESVPAPVIAMVNGLAFGGGLEMAIACDLRVASDRAVFAMTPARLGVIYRPAGLMRFAAAIGLPATRELFYTAAQVSAERALQLGLVNRVCAPADVARVTYETAETIAANAPLAVRGTKRILAMCTAFRGLPEDDAAEAEVWIRRCMESADLKEGKKAFAEKRKPRFSGR